MHNNLDMALKYSKLGFSVIPCRPDKKPTIKWQSYQERKATEEEIERWFSKGPSPNIGIVTGKISGVCVVDADSPKAYEKVQENLPDDLIIPVVKTPRGYHLYFSCPDTPLANKTNFLPQTDFKSEGAYVIAPPSRNSEGEEYLWLPGSSVFEVNPPPLPETLASMLNNKDIFNNIYKQGRFEECDHKRPQLTTTDHRMFVEGRRDEDLYHIAYCLARGGARRDEIVQVLEKLAKSCEPPFPLKEVNAKIESAFKRIQSRERNLSEEIREWLMTTSDHIVTTDVHKELQLTTRREKKTATMVLLRFVEEGILEKLERHGHFRKVNREAEPVDWLNAPTDEFPIIWPLGIHELCRIYPGNIIIIAGSKSAGKTAFLLNVVKLNQAKHEIIYLNSEMGDTEFRKRLELFSPGIQLQDWRFKAYHRNSKFEDLITAEGKIFIVDFLEVTKDFWLVAETLKKIHEKLKEGIAIIALQKSESKDLGRGGDFSIERARLYLTLDCLPDKEINRLKIRDAKAWRGSLNPRGQYIDFKLINGTGFLPQTGWQEGKN